jgi:glycosyltransferase involved in cell wall biosynthesis
MPRTTSTKHGGKSVFTATFVMETVLGNRTYYENLRSFIDWMPQVRAHWVEVSYFSEQSLWARLKLLPPHLRGPLMGRQQVRRGLRQRTADVAVFNTQVLGIHAGRLVNKQPYVLCSDLTPLRLDEMADAYGHRLEGNAIIKWYKHQANVRLMQGAARVFPMSHWNAQSVINDYGVDASRVEVISPGVDLTVWRPAEKEPQGPMRILFVGADIYRKGGDDLLAAFRSLPAGSAELVLVTRTKLPPEQGVFVYNNMQPNAPELLALYQSCDVFVLPTKAEGFGIVAVEASAIGLPVVATAVGGLTDIVADGETGLLMPPGDIRILTNHLRLLAENHDLRRRLGCGARARAEARFDAKANAARMVDLLEQIVSESRAK